MVDILSYRLKFVTDGIVGHSRKVDYRIDPSQQFLRYVPYIAEILCIEYAFWQNRGISSWHREECGIKPHHLCIGKGAPKVLGSDSTNVTHIARDQHFHF
jgi:hypothetical protein